MNPRQFLQLIIQPTLNHMARVNPRMSGPTAEALLLGTALVESNLTFLRQTPTGPALGVYQMEPGTHSSLWANWLGYRPDAAGVIQQLTTSPARADHMVWNLQYATAMCRLRYWIVPAALPPMHDRALADYHKDHYNTHLGKTNPAESSRHFDRAISIVRAAQ
jgi:hypothetical protein